MEGHNESVLPAAAEGEQVKPVTTVTGAIDAAAAHEQAKAEAAAVATDAAAYRHAAEKVRQTGEALAAAQRRAAELEQARKHDAEQQRRDHAASLDKRAEELRTDLSAALAPVREARQAEERRHTQALEELAQREAAVCGEFKAAEIALQEERAGRAPETAARIARLTVDIVKVRAEYPATLNQDLADAEAAVRSADHAVTHIRATGAKTPGQYEGQVAALEAATGKTEELRKQRSERDARLALLAEELETVKRT